MLLPLRSDRPLRRTPWVNYSLILVNLVVFFLTSGLIAQSRMMPVSLTGQADGLNIIDFYLRPDAPRLYQFFTWAFLHDGGMHLLGNMVFLFAFGNSVEDRLGRLNYLLFYLCGAVVSGLGHVIASDAPALGASGAVAAVSGAFIALFPRCYITVVWYFIVVGSFEVSALGLLTFYIVKDIVQWALDWGHVAYAAHLSGYAIGFVMAFGLLVARLLRREPYDIFSLFEHRRRRTQFASMTRQGYQPWEHNPSQDPGAYAPPPQVRADPSGHGVDARGPGAPPSPGLSDARKAEVIALRSAISESLRRHDVAAAAEQYTRLLGLDGSQVLGPGQQRDVANQLMAERKHPQAAQAYELFVNTYPRQPGVEEMQLMLGLIYTRYIERLQRAREVLIAASQRLRGDHKDLANQLLGEVERRSQSIGG